MTLNDDVCKVSLNEVSEVISVFAFQMLMIDFAFLGLGLLAGFFFAYAKYKD